MCICFVTIVLIKAITRHSKLSLTSIFHCGSSRSFHMKGAHLNKAHNMLWMQPVGYFSSTHKSRWGIFLNFSEMPTANLTLTVGTELKPGHWSDHQLQDTGWLPASWAHLSLFSLEKWTALRNRVSNRDKRKNLLCSYTTVSPVAPVFQFTTGLAWPPSAAPSAGSLYRSLHLSALTLLLLQTDKHQTLSKSTATHV